MAALRLADAYGVPAEREPDAAVGARGPGGGRDQAQGRQDGGTAGGAVAGGEEGASHSGPGAGSHLSILNAQWIVVRSGRDWKT